MIDNSKKITENKPPFYKSSWIDHFSDWIRHLPGNPWGYYLGLAVSLLVCQVFVLGIEGGEITRDLHPMQIFLCVAIPYILASIPFFNDGALSALETTKPVLSVDQAHYQQLAFQLTHLPAIPTILASILALGSAFISEYITGSIYQIDSLTGYPLTSSIFRGLYIACWWCFGIFCYHTIHQLSIINNIYTHYTKIDLFKRKPLYGFSNLSALKAISLLILPYSFLYLNPIIDITGSAVLGIYLIISLIALCSFLLPQIGIHRLQNEEKDRLLDEANKRYESAVSQLHGYVDDENYDNVANLTTAIGSLEQEIKTLEKIPTWPWEPETFRWLITAMVLPLMVWIAQYFLSRWLSP